MRLALKLSIVSLGVMSALCFMIQAYASPEEELHNAIHSGDITKVETCLKVKDINVNALNKQGDTCLISALLSQKEDIAKLLLTQKDIDVNIEGKFGGKALGWAGYHGFTGIVKLILEKDADIDYVRNGSYNALINATENGRDETANLLISRGANVHVRDQNDNTPLLLAARSGCISTVKELLARDVDVNEENKWGCTPLILASQGGHTKVVRLLLEKKNVNTHAATREYAKMTALDYAKRDGHHEITNLILEYKRPKYFSTKEQV